MGESINNSFENISEEDSDSNYSELNESNSFDIFCKILEKDFSSRDDSDLNLLLEFIQYLPAFSNLTRQTKLQLCRAMISAVVEESGTTVLNHGEEIDSWCVIVNGGVYVENDDGGFFSLKVGDSFGVKGTDEKVFQKGVMRTTQNDTQFLCVLKDEYKEIIESNSSAMVKTEFDGKLIAVFEKRQHSQIVIRATTDWLIDNLINYDESYIPVFLLTFRGFVDDPLKFTAKIMDWLSRPNCIEQVFDLFYTFLTNHFMYFENDDFMWDFFHQFCERITKLGAFDKLHKLAHECSLRSHRRVVTVCDCSIDFDYFVSSLGVFIKKSSTGDLKRGDRIFKINETSTEKLSRDKIAQIIAAAPKYSLHVRIDISGFFQSLGLLPKSATFTETPKSPRGSFKKNKISNNPRQFHDSIATTKAIHAVKVYKDKNVQYIPINSKTTISQLIDAAVPLFKENEDPSLYSLFNVSINNSTIRSRKLANDSSDIWHNLSVGSRYYLALNGTSPRLNTSEITRELLNDSIVLLERIPSKQLATAIDIRHKNLFFNIDPFEYIADVCQLKCDQISLRDFSELCNFDMFWVISEICGQSDINKRARLIRTFISAADHLHKIGNFNAALAIVSGLCHRAVDRLLQTWEKISFRQMRTFRRLSKLCDPSRNMACYRSSLISQLEKGENMIIPYYPILRKDLWFIDETNDSYIDGLVNFDKWRTMAAQIDKFYQQPRKGVEIVGTLKKIHDDGMLLKKVCSYFESVLVICDSDRLLKLSLDQEPSVSTVSEEESLSMMDEMSNNSGKFSSLSFDQKLLKLSNSSHRISTSQIIKSKYSNLFIKKYKKS